ncbi:MAG: HD domain-containing protein [Prevotella sp.]|nr:HD domain-containing protein [Prevotella sp.]
MKLYTDDELAGLLGTHDIFRLIGQTADEAGVECYVVGGYVRDLFLERPSDDIDVVVVGSGIDVASALKKKLGRQAHLSVFRNFGTAQIKCGSLEVEFVGARRESYSHDSRKPIVEDGTLEDDQNRRDFTINAMAICLNKGRFGQLVDPFNGLADLEDGIIATPLDPEVTFSDDPLRMMRCVRFATQLHFQIEDATLDGLEKMAQRIRIVSAERISVELNKIMMAPQPSIGFVEMQRTGLLQLILPEVAALDIVEQRNGRAHKNNFYHTLEVLDNVASRNASLWLRWAALLHDIGKPKSKRWDAAQGWTFHNHNYLGAKMVAPIFRRLKLPLGQDEMKYVEKLVDLHMRPQVIADDVVTDSAVRRLLSDAGDDIDDLMTLCEADITSKNEVKKKIFLENFRMVRSKLTDLVEKDYKRLLQPVIDGNEIMQLFNLRPSRVVGILKQFLKDAVLDNRVPNEREPLMQLLMEKAGSLGLKMSKP